MIDNFPGQHGSITPYRSGAAITPHDTNELATLPRALMAYTTAGIISVVLADDATAAPVTIYLPLGVAVPCRARIVRAAGAVAAGITALW